MSSHLFLFTLTPVQSFIEQARKAGDLYGGSFLLSHMCRKAADSLNIPSEGIIFPDIKAANIPNRFLARVEGVPTAAEEMGTKVQNEFTELSARILEKLNLTKPSGWDQQLAGNFVTSWAALPLDRDYKTTYRSLESMMGGVKQARMFGQLTEAGRKCALCGERNVKIYRPAGTDDRSHILASKLFMSDQKVCLFIGDREGNTPTLPLKYLQPGEGLCAVCFTKRALDAAGLEEFIASFPSTSDVALMQAMEELKRDQSVTIPESYDSQGIFALQAGQALTEEHEHHAGTLSLHAKIEETKLHPAPYYAILLFDGDSMGQWLTGAKFEDQSDLEKFHCDLTKALTDYAKTAADLVRDPKGVTVYAGGDDFLGFVNLSHLLRTLKELREKFSQKVLRGKGLTFSAGIAIGHIKTPLREVLGWARRMEHEAKALEGKNAWALAILRHSGEVSQTAFHWTLEAPTTDPPSRGIWPSQVLERLVGQIQTDGISSAFIQNLLTELKRLKPDSLNANDCALVEAEIGRLLNRACHPMPDEDKAAFEKRKREEVLPLGQDLICLFAAGGPRDNFEGFLSTAGFLARTLKGE